MTCSRNVFLISIMVLVGCQRDIPTLQEGLRLYQQNQLEAAKGIFEARAASDSVDGLTLAYLADLYRRTGSPQRAVETARMALLIDACLSFSHCVIAEATIPSAKNWEGTNADTAWTHLLAAAECDRSDGHPWLILWGESIRRGDLERVSLAARRLSETGLFSPALLAYNRWVLAGLPLRAILVTNGDMDTYPIAVLQEMEGIRPDVVLVNRGTLNESWYARFLRDVKGVELPFNDEMLDGLSARRRADGTLELPSEQVLQGWVRMWRDGTFDRPVAFASTVDEATIARTPDPLQHCGAFTAVLKEPSDRPDVKTIERALSGFNPGDFFGPWVTEQDRSPVRRIGTKNIVRNVSNAALTLAEQAALAGDGKAFDRWLAYAKAIENGAELGPVYSERIRQLEEKGVLRRP